MPSSDDFRRLTDEQIVWLYINEQLDVEDKLNSLCPQCYHEVTEEVHCTRCGKLLVGDEEDLEAGIDEGFDMDRYEQLKNGNFVWGDIDEEDVEEITKDVTDLPVFYEDEIPDDLQVDVSDSVDDDEYEVYTDIFELIDNINEYEDELNREQDIEGE